MAPSNFVPVDPAGDLHVRLEVVLFDAFFDLWAHLAVASKHLFHISAVFHNATDGHKKKQLPLLGGESTDADQSADLRGNGCGFVEK